MNSKKYYLDGILALLNEKYKNNVYLTLIRF